MEPEFDRREAQRGVSNVTAKCCRMYEHLDLFSGIGGFAIAARAAGFETVAFCEADERCRTFLEKTWGKPVHPDIRTFDAKPYRGISLLTGGPPCQPASRAGKQGGKTDDRWLWDSALRVLGEAEPDCVVFENPPGIGDVGLDGILSEMGRLGYEVQVFDIPACAVDSPQLRHRFWIVGFRMGDALCQRRRHGSEQNGEQIESEQSTPRRRNALRSVDDMADPAGPGRERPDAERGENGCRPQRPQSLVANAENMHGRSEQQPGEPSSDGWTGLAGSAAWQSSVWVPCADRKLRRAPDDSFGLVDGLHRSLLAALGNSISPQVAIPILRACRDLIDATAKRCHT